MFWFRSKLSLECFHLGWYCFWVKLPTLSKGKTIFRNWNHYSKCRELMENSQTVMDVLFSYLGTFLKSLGSPQVKHRLIKYSAKSNKIKPNWTRPENLRMSFRTHCNRYSRIHRGRAATTPGGGDWAPVYFST